MWSASFLVLVKSPAAENVCCQRPDVALCRAAAASNVSALFRPKWKHTVHMYVFKCCAKPKNRACKSLTHKTRAVLYKRSACKVHTHTRAYQFHVKRVLGPGTKLIPSILSWSQQNDLKTTFLIILSHQIKRMLRLSKKKKKKKGSPTYPKRLSKSSYLCTTTNSEQLRRIARVTRMPQEPLHFTALVS